MEALNRSSFRHESILLETDLKIRDVPRAVTKIQCNYAQNKNSNDSEFFHEQVHEHRSAVVKKDSIKSNNQDIIQISKNNHEAAEVFTKQ